ncbi:MAG TPA: helix-turn-helix domain-containing protein [Solirubrobacteraceae bacterium]
MAGTELLTVSQAAEALSASSQTIRNWIRGDRLHGVRIGNRFLIPREEIERMRGGVFAVTGESPWDFDESEPGQPLPRGGARSAPGPGDELLGG